MAFSLRKTSYVVSACVVGIQFISPLFPDGSVTALGWTLGLAVIPLILGIVARSPRAVVVAITAGFSPVLLLWAAYMVSFLFVYHQFWQHCLDLVAEKTLRQCSSCEITS